MTPTLTTFQPLDYKQLVAEETSHGANALPADAVTVGKVAVGNSSTAANVLAAPDMKVNSAVTTTLGSSAGNAAPLLNPDGNGTAKAITVAESHVTGNAAPQATALFNNVASTDSTTHMVDIGLHSSNGGSSLVNTLAGADGTNGSTGGNGNDGTDGGTTPDGGNAPQHLLPLNLDSTLGNALENSGAHVAVPQLSQLLTTDAPLATLGETGNSPTQLLTSTGLVPQGLQPLLQNILPVTDGLNVALPASGQLLSGNGSLLGLSLDGSSTHGSVANLNLANSLLSNLPVDTGPLQMVTGMLPGGLLETSVPQGGTPQAFTDNLTQVLSSTMASGASGLVPDLTTLPNTLTNLPNLVLADVTGHAQTNMGSLLDTHLLDQTQDATTPTTTLSVAGNDVNLPMPDLTNLPLSGDLTNPLSTMSLGSDNAPIAVTALETPVNQLFGTTLDSVLQPTDSSAATALPVTTLTDAIDSSSSSGVVTNATSLVTDTIGSVESAINSLVSSAAGDNSASSSSVTDSVAAAVDTTSHATSSALTTITNTAASVPTAVTTLSNLGHGLFHH